MNQAQEHGGSVLASSTVLTSVLENALKNIKADDSGVHVNVRKLIGQNTPVLRASKTYQKWVGSDSEEEEDE
jgi:hypothetical protein